MVIAFAAVDIPSLIAVVAMGASDGLLKAVPPPAIRDDSTLCPGFSLIGPGWFLWLSSLFRRSSANAAAPVSGMGENPGVNVPLNRGDFGDGEAPNPAFAIEVKFVEFEDWSGRARFSDFPRTGSESGWLVIAVVVGAVAGCSTIEADIGGAADTPPSSDAMRFECSFPL
jgi:hypothetical protein